MSDDNEFPSLADVRAELQASGEIPPPEEPAKVEPAKVEPAAVVPPPEPANDVAKESKAWAAVANADKRTRKMAEQAKAEKAEAEKLAKQAAEDRAEAEKLRGGSKKAKQAPLDYLKEAGLEVEDVLRAALNDGKPSPELKDRARDEELAATKQQVLDARKTIEEYIANEKKVKEEREQKAQVDGFKAQIAQLVSATPDDYALLLDLHGDDAKDAVFDRIDSHYSRTMRDSGEGEILSMKQAADAIEADLMEQIAARIPKLLPILEKRGKFKPAEQPKPAPVTAGKTPVSTLTNDLVAATPPATKVYGHLDETDEFEGLVEELKAFHKSKAKK